MKVPNKIDNVICTGNIGNRETYDWLRGLSPNLHVVKGD
jgi:vacuolar protein sorting-associated protein 29